MSTNAQPVVNISIIAPTITNAKQAVVTDTAVI